MAVTVSKLFLAPQCLFLSHSVVVLRCSSSYCTSSRALLQHTDTPIAATAASGAAAAAAAVCGHCQSAALPAGAIMQSLQQQSRHLHPQHRAARTVQHMVHCSFSFANSERANRPTGRRNRYQEKKHGEGAHALGTVPRCQQCVWGEGGTTQASTQLATAAEQELRTIAQGLCNLSGKQLQAVSHLLTEAHLREIRIGMDIPPTNQVWTASPASSCWWCMQPQLCERYHPPQQLCSRRFNLSFLSVSHLPAGSFLISGLDLCSCHVCLSCCSAGSQASGWPSHEAAAYRPG